MTESDHPNAWCYSPLSFLSSFANLMTGNRLLFAEAYGEMLHSTSSLVMLATSRTPAQWITGLPRASATQSPETRSAAKRK
jgi:hypothetical protein